MIDREKVINGVECHRKKVQTTKAVSCLKCPYSEPNPIREWCMSGLMDDIYVLLKEQEAKWIEYPECLAYDGAYSDSHIVCSACKHVFSTMDNCTEEFGYCPNCGAKMKQEGR